MTIIDRVNLETKRIKEHQISKNGYENYKLTFGGKFGLKWFLPVAPETTIRVEELYSWMI